MESLETIQTRHRKEQRELQARITNKKKNATKKTRKGVNDECAELERQLKEKHEQEIAALNGNGENTENATEEQNQPEETSQDQPPTDATNGISQQLKTVTFSDPDPEPEPITQQSGPKKRNRQKERMARRAAEQEAAAEAAEQEAANMTDHRKTEKTYLLKEFKANNLVEKEIQPDGHCLFSAIADQLQTRGVSLISGLGAGKSEEEVKGKPPYSIVRIAATNYMRAHEDDFAPFLEEPFGSYVAKIRDTAEWGGQLELLALASAYGVEIKVLQDGRTETIEPRDDANKKENGERHKIWLAYYRHGYGLGEHYNSLRKAD
ncbi:cysteine proteinase [Hypoxylon trugodes]|uniref:cysteine proteinase n=1 Tax=Hypoxylon trugodes TaxID=326681 RepID=UPI0021978E28|nr:cysteine proteinase [Hypoxylon trugodes]KAI1389685.1 cysteine proteinase [Hypoxylon trugodes]